MLERNSITSVHIKLSLDIILGSTMRNIVLIILFAALANAKKYKFCAPWEVVTDSACFAVQRGNSPISCLRVTDSAECSIRLAQGEADFGIFNAEELLLAYPFYQSDIVPILQLRHRDNLREDFEFQTVAVVHKSLTQDLEPPDVAINRLKGGGLCHPGFSKAQWWNDYILKYFEKTIGSRECQENVSVIENEVRNIRNFFGKACRPGEWASESSIDRELKRKYPELCALCDNQTACTYNKKEKHGHYGALECLTEKRGKVAYVALSYVRQYLKANSTYQFLCKNGEKFPLDTPNPCAWIKQPWSVVAAKTEGADELKIKLSQWLKPDSQDEPWKKTLSSIIQEDSIAFNMTENLSLAMYLSKGRDIDLKNTQTCEKRTIRWCTVSDMETNKCERVARAAMALGIEPHISCVQSNSVLQCLRKITEKRADIITIDSNYGYMARKVYGLSTVLYCDTKNEENSRVIAVVREESKNNPIKSFPDLKGRKACFPEYAGISWLSFVNIARKEGIISSKSCDYPLLISQLFSGACTPGIKDRDHSNRIASADVSSKLCSACTHSNNTSCAANSTNRYYRDNGAMRCLEEGAGDVAFVEVANIIPEISTADQNKYRMLCKNGSLAVHPGFIPIDDDCPLSVTIDSEIIGRKNDSKSNNTDVLQTFLKIEEWLGYRVNSQRPIHVYGPFNGIYNLLFKNSTSGLVSTSSTQKTVQAYKDLFSHMYQCSSGHLTATANYIFVALVALYHILPSQT